MDKLSKAAKKEKKSIAAEQQREMYYLIALFGMLAIAAAVIILEYIYRVTRVRGIKICGSILIFNTNPLVTLTKKIKDKNVFLSL